MSDSQKIGRAVDLCCELQYGINALCAVQTAMSNGPNDPKSFTDGLFCVADYLHEKAKALSSLLEGEEE